MFINNASAFTSAQLDDVCLQPETAKWFFDPLPAHSYDLVVIDPPWSFATWSPAGQAKSPSKHYRTMPLDEIMALPVRRLLKDNAVVYLWTTGAMRENAHAVMAAWGITYKTELVWRKVTPSGKARWGCGYWARSLHEPILLGTVGKPSRFALPSCFDGLAREHSRKPDEFYHMLTARTPGLRRADIFARQKREEWDCWGDEVEKFPTASGITYGSEHPGVRP